MARAQTHGPDELLRAILPPPLQVRHERTASIFLESLALWLDTPLPVVLSVDAQQAGFCLGLTDELGIGATSLSYRVDVLERGHRRRRAGLGIHSGRGLRDGLQQH